MNESLERKRFVNTYGSPAKIYDLEGDVIEVDKCTMSSNELWVHYRKGKAYLSSPTSQIMMVQWLDL